MSEVSGSLYRSFSLLETEKWPEGRDERRTRVSLPLQPFSFISLRGFTHGSPFIV